MDDIAISFCITVYNQSDMVKRCIDSIVAYPGNDIEIIVSDDRSTEDIRKLADSYRDSRIRYFVNDRNEGHDRNILRALSHAGGKYAFLLRSRDRILADAVPLMVREAGTGNWSYITGTALNQDGAVKIRYTRESFAQGAEALQANYDLFIHPSGNMYRMKDVDPEALRRFLDEEEVPRNGFIVHSLIRLQLAAAGDFRLIREPVWVYADTEEAKDLAVNRSTEGVSVYDPSLIEKRYLYEMEWARRILPPEQYYPVMKTAAALYLDLATWGFKLTNGDKRVRQHYDFRKVRFSVREERKRFRELCDSLFDEKDGVSRETFRADMDAVFRKNRTKDAVKYAVRAATNGTPLYHMAARIYKKVFKGL